MGEDAPFYDGPDALLLCWLLNQFMRDILHPVVVLSNTSLASQVDQDYWLALVAYEHTGSHISTFPLTLIEAYGLQK